MAVEPWQIKREGKRVLFSIGGPPPYGAPHTGTPALYDAARLTHLAGSYAHVIQIHDA